MLDVVLTLIVWSMIVPIAPIRRVFTPRRLRLGRLAVVALCLAFLGHSVMGEPLFRPNWTDSAATVTVHRYQKSPRVSSIAQIAWQVNRELRGLHNSRDGLLPVNVTLVDASPATIDAVLANQQLQQVEFRNCELLPRHCDRLLDLAVLRELKLVDCRFAKRWSDELISQRNLTGLTIDNGDERIEYEAESGSGSFRATNLQDRPDYVMRWTTKGGEILVGDTVSSLELVVPNHIDSKLTILNIPKVSNIQLRNTVGEIPDSVCELVVPDAPLLTRITTDNYQKVSMAVGSAPNLVTIDGFFDRDRNYQARLTSLIISGRTQLRRLAIDISEMETLELGPSSTAPIMEQLSLRGRSGMRVGSSSLLPSGKCQQLMRAFSPVSVVNRLDLGGLVVDATVFRAFPFVSYTLNLNDCKMGDERVLEPARPIKSLSSAFTLTGEGFSPNVQQLNALLSWMPGLEDLEISGRNLDTLSMLQGNSLSNVTISDINFDAVKSKGLNLGSVDVLIIYGSNLGPDLLLSWQLPKVERLELINCPLTSDICEQLRERFPNLEECIILSL